MSAAVIVDAIRTGTGQRNGRLRGWHPADLAGRVLAALVERSDLNPALVDDVIMGCVTQVGEQGVNVGRSAVLAAGFPETVPATTVDRQGASSQQALHFAAQGVISGAYDVVIAAGVEAMSRVPLGASMQVGGRPFGPGVLDRYGEEGGLVPQGISAEIVADRWGLSRQDLDAFAVRSQQRAARAHAGGRFDHEILPVAVRDEQGSDTGEVLDHDEAIRADATAEALAALKPTFKADGKVTAGNSAQIADGAAALLVTSEEKAAQLGLEPRARVHAFSTAAVDPLAVLTGPVPATERVLERAKLVVDDIDMFEIDEAFSSVVLAWQAQVHGDMDRVNVNGGAIALGNPVGCAGARVMTTLVHELGRTGGRYGLQAMSGGGGVANATVVERL
jgi:acetyl-CoA acetyltransferase family protein